MNHEQLAQVEALVENLYTGQDVEKRRRAEAELRVFATSAEYIPRCQFILDNSRNQYALHLAASSLRTLITTFWNHFTVDNRLEVRNYILTYLASNAASLAPFVVTSLIQLCCRITKLGWFDADAHQEITTEVTKFLEASVTHCIIGVQFLNALIEEMDQSMPGKSLTHHRKTAVSFRDIALFRIFQISFTTLRQLPSYQANREDTAKLQTQALILAKKCLSYDFLGTSIDDSSDDLGPLQIPKTWRTVIQDPQTTQVFFEIYQTGQVPHTHRALECLVQLASVRKSLFPTDADRTTFLTRLLVGMCNILRTRHGLSNPDNYNEFVRMLSAVKANYQLPELVNTSVYSEWIKLVTDLTIETLRTLEWVVPGSELANGLFYLMHLWSRLVSASSPYASKSNASANNQLDVYAPQVAMAYIEARVEAVGKGLLEDVDEDIDFDQDQTLFQAFPDICKCEYEKICHFVISLLDPRVVNYRSYVESYPRGSVVPPNVQQRKLQLDHELTWLLYIIGAIISTRVRSNHKDAFAMNDGHLASRVFQLVRLSEHEARSGNDPRLEIALMYFFSQFRAVYIGDQALTASKVYQPLGELVGLKDHVSVLNVMVTRIGLNLRLWPENKTIIYKALRLFKELAVGMSSATMLAGLDATKLIMRNHSAEHFPFLNVLNNFRARTLYYGTLGRLLFQYPCDPVQMEEFMRPFEAVLAGLESTPVRPDNDYVVPLVGLFRDLRGLCSASVNSRSYVMLFDWMYPRCFDLVVRACEQLANMPNVTVPLLKFMAESVHNKGSRITFNSSSPNGILLFREASKIICTLGQALPQHNVQRDHYAEIYKPSWICLSIMCRALTGAYVNLGVFALYNDTALEHGLNASLKLALALPQKDILSYRKVAREYYSFCEILSNSHRPFMWNLPSNVFGQILASLREGVGSLDITVSSKSCSALDNLACFQLKTLPKGDTPIARAIRAQIDAHGPVFADILKVLFRLAVHEQTANQWSLSRPMLTVLLTNEHAFQELKQEWASTLSAENQQKLHEAFDKLMTGISPTLSTKTRDVFSRNFSDFRRMLKTFM